MDPLDFISQAEPNALDALYQQYCSDPESVDASWQLFFKGFDLALASYDKEAPTPQTLKEFQVINLIQAYRSRGHSIYPDQSRSRTSGIHARFELVQFWTF